MASSAIDAAIRPRRKRDATPERPWSSTPAERTWSTSSGSFEGDDEHVFSDADCYQSSEVSFVGGIFWKLVDISLWAFQLVTLVLSIAVWIIFVAVSLIFSFVRWSFSWQGLLFLCPAIIAALIYGIFAALEDGGTPSVVYHLIEQHKGNATRILQEVQLSPQVSAEKTLGGGFFARRSALELAATKGYVEVIHSLLKVGKSPSVGWIFGPLSCLGSASPLVAAATHGHAEALATLLGAGASGDMGWTYGPFGILGRSAPIGHAASGGHTELLRLLLKSNVSVDTGWLWGASGIFGSVSALRAAAWNGHSSAVQTLLEARASPDMGSSIGPFGVFWSDTPLLSAAWNGDLVSVRALLSAGASVNSGYGEELRKSAYHGHVPITQELLDAGAVPDSGGKAIQAAVRNGHLSVAQMLKEAMTAAAKNQQRGV